MEGPARGGLRFRDAFAIAALACPLGSADALAQQYDESLLSALEWTNIGPPRGGLSQAVAGSASWSLE